MLSQAQQALERLESLEIVAHQIQAPTSTQELK